MNKIPLEDACYSEQMIRIAYAVLARHWRLWGSAQPPMPPHEYIRRTADYYERQGLPGVSGHLRMLAPAPGWSIRRVMDAQIHDMRVHHHNRKMKGSNK